MLISEADATWAADEFINYFGNFTSIEDYLRFVKRELVPKTNPLMSHEDEFFNEDISPEEMEFEINVEPFFIDQVYVDQPAAVVFSRFNLIRQGAPIQPIV